MNNYELIYGLMKKYIPCKQYIKKRKNLEFLIVSNLNQEIYYLNQTASFIYENCNEKNTIEDIYQNLLKEYDAEPNELKEDLINLIRDFQWQNIIFIKEEKKHEEIC